jgi:uncharacterized protein (DUF1330 family)
MGRNKMKYLLAMLVGIVLAVVGLMYFQSINNVEAVAGEEAPHSTAYMLVLGEVYDRPAFMQGYAAKLEPLYDKYGGGYIAIGGGPAIEVLEGNYVPLSFVISKWKSREDARRFWNSEEYDELRRARIDNNWGKFDVLLVEGLPQSK